MVFFIRLYRDAQSTQQKVSKFCLAKQLLFDTHKYCEGKMQCYLLLKIAFQMLTAMVCKT